MAWKSGIKKSAFPVFSVQTILLSDLVECDRLFGTPLLSAEGYHTQPRKFAFKQKGRNCHYYLQRAVKTDWMGSIVLCVFSRVEKPSDYINSPLVLLNKKGLRDTRLAKVGEGENLGKNVCDSAFTKVLLREQRFSPTWLHDSA